ncbi:MAG: alpha-L-fucosidase [Bryobacteraceae bacterium]
MRRKLVLTFILLAGGAAAQNRPERLEWFRDQGFGLFIHWSLDSQVGSVISHSMVGASPAYLNFFLHDLPRTFNPQKFRPADWAALARLAGIRYVVFTSKHHSGFAMWPTATTDFHIGNTPYLRDLTGELLSAFRAQDIAPGLYFSPDDFWWLHTNGKTLQRNTPEVAPANNPGLLAHDRAQVRELMTRYGNIDVVFFDGPPEGLKELAWELQPSTVVTRGAMETPEQYVPGVPLEGAWEANLTMGNQWQYKPEENDYKSAAELIRVLIETRAKGGNLLLNIGPKPDGEIPIEQEERLRVIALWMAINSEAIYAVRPWVITNEGNVWFTRSKDGSALYAMVDHRADWKYGAWREITLRSVKATPGTQASVLGQSDAVLEYQPNVRPKTTWEQTADGLKIRAMHAQRIYNNRRWPHPIVLKLTGVEPALTPPAVVTGDARWEGAARLMTLAGEVANLGQAAEVEVGFEYRDVTGLDLTERPGGYQRTALTRRNATGRFTTVVRDWRPGRTYEVRAVVVHPLLTTYGQERKVSTR